MSEYVVLVSVNSWRKGQTVVADDLTNLVKAGYLREVKHDRDDAGVHTAVVADMGTRPVARVPRRRKAQEEVSHVEDRAEQAAGPQDGEK